MSSLNDYEEYENYLMHYGMPRRSGRYPWGSGKDPYQHSADFLSRVESLEKKGKSQKEIADAMEISTTDLRIYKSIAKDIRRQDLVKTAKGLREKGYSLNQIADKMGFKNDSSVRTLLDDNRAERMNSTRTTMEFLKQAIKDNAEKYGDKGMIDVSVGAEKEIGDISRTKLKQALKGLELEGYVVYGGGIPQVTNKGQQTNQLVLCPPGTEHKEIFDFTHVHSLRNYDKVLANDGNDIRPSFIYPESLNSKRLKVRYSEEGGIDKDGLIEIRPGCKDLNLGDGVHYSQVRIMVDGTHYLKGMAVYGDPKDFPKGVDIIFNTNKTKGTPALGEKDHTVLKNIKNDPQNPFGSLIKDIEHGGQSFYDDPNGKYTNSETGKKQSLSLINKRADEGDWGDWSHSLPSQFLAKQPEQLIKKQLGLSLADKKDEYDEIKNLTNPTVKKRLLASFAEDCDSAAVHLKAAALPGQQYQVILPLITVKDNEVYAPNFHEGSQVALVRYPHGGTFEIPILKVNNHIPEGDRMITKNAADAVGISKKVADRLSGADFDGDTVMVIPINSKIKIQNHEPLKGLKDFDPKDMYGPESTTVPYKRMKDTQKQMGVISNLITDMTLKGATEDELARAVRHSMVVIDAEKHNLNYKQSYEDNGIAALKKKYQGHIDPETGRYREGAQTLISRAKSEKAVLKRQGSPIINPDGSLSYKTSDKLYYDEKVKVREKDPVTGRYLKDKDGKWVYKKDDKGNYIYETTGKVKTRLQKSTQMAETNDAYTLVSDMNNPKEKAYAEYANGLKSLANQARKEMINTPNLKYDPEAAKTYTSQVSHLNSQLNLALKNAPREREAERIANTIVDAKKAADPDLTNKEISKINQQALEEARNRVGAKRHAIDITDDDWKAIQAGAITDNKLKDILKYTDTDKIKQLATPRSNGTLSEAKIARIKAMSASGYTNDEIAQAVGISASTVLKYKKGN